MTNNQNPMVLVPLSECPPGPFRFNDILGFKTEYGAMRTVGPVNVPGDQVRWTVSHWPDAYVMASGEYFWGGTSTHEDRAKLMVEPIDPEALFTSPAPATEEAPHRTTAPWARVRWGG